MTDRPAVMSPALMVSAMALLAVPCVAHAQVTTQSGLDYNAREVMLSVGGRYESNISRSSAQVAAVRGLERSDFRVTPALEFALGLPVSDRGVVLSGQVGYDFHARNSRLDRERLALGLVGSVGVSSCEIEPSMSLTRSQSDLANLLIGGPGVPLTTKNTQTGQDYAARLTCGGNYGLRPAIEGSRSIGDNSDQLRQLGDYRTWRYGSGIRYSHPRVGDLYAFVRRADTRFPERLTPLQRDGYRNISYGVTAERDIGTSLRAAATLAKNSMRVADPSIRGFNGLTWSAALTATPGPRTQISASVGRELSDTLGTTAGYVLTKTYALEGSYAVSERLTMRAGVNHAPREYGIPSDQVFLFPTNDKQTSAFVSANYRLNQRIDIGLDAGIDRRRADGTFYDYSNTFGGLTVRWRI